jgi:hypothetical protein
MIKSELVSRIEGDDSRAYIVASNVARRHMSKGQQAMAKTLHRFGCFTLGFVSPSIASFRTHTEWSRELPYRSTWLGRFPSPISGVG